MAASLGVAHGLGGDGDRYLFFVFVPLSLRELRPFLGKDARMSCAARAAAHDHTLSHCRSPRLHCGRAESGGPAVDSDLGWQLFIWWQLRDGMDVGLFYGPRIPNSEFQMPEIERNRRWIVTAMVMAIGFIAELGPGVKFHAL